MVKINPPLMFSGACGNAFAGTPRSVSCRLLFKLMTRHLYPPDVARASPAMETGWRQHVWSAEEIVALLDTPR